MASLCALLRSRCLLMNRSFYFYCSRIYLLLLHAVGVCNASSETRLFTARTIQRHMCGISRNQADLTWVCRRCTAGSSIIFPCVDICMTQDCLWRRWYFPHPCAACLGSLCPVCQPSYLLSSYLGVLRVSCSSWSLSFCVSWRVSWISCTKSVGSD